MAITCIVVDVEKLLAVGTMGGSGATQEANADWGACVGNTRGHREA